jgi:hypothetical protein
MVLFTKLYGELSLRIQQSLQRCNIATHKKGLAFLFLVPNQNLEQKK